MLDWKIILKTIPKEYSELFYKYYDGEFKVCSKCMREYPKHKLFFVIHGATKDGFHYCRECKGKLFSRIKNNEEASYFKALHYIFKLEIAENYATKKFCYSCKVFKDKNNQIFSIYGAYCRECTGVEMHESLYWENVILSKTGNKKCKYCLLVKKIDEFQRLKNKISQHCLDCVYLAKKIKREYDQNYFKANFDAKKEYYNEWKKSGGQSLRNINEQNRRSIKMELTHDLTIEQWMQCLNYFDNSCAYCGLSNQEQQDKFNKLLSQDHVIPVCKNGTYTASNIIPACTSCNSSKNRNDLESFLEYGTDFTIERYENIKNYISLIEESLTELISY